MSIDVKSTAMSTASAPISNNKVSSAGTDKTSSDSAFKDEMEKVSVTNEENKVNDKTVAKDKKDVETKTQSENKKSESEESQLNAEIVSQDQVSDNGLNNIIQGNISYSSCQAFSDANNLLQNDIAQMIENTASISPMRNSVCTISFGKNTNNFSMSAEDAQFFINLTQSGDVSARNMLSQAQNLLNSGVNSKQVAQNFKVSQALLNALSESRQNNQPLRIDFDQNISVILRVGKDGAIAANFIPVDKAVEQYLKSNIESLKATFEEKNLPYSELSYSNSSKQQNQRRRNQQRGE